MQSSPGKFIPRFPSQSEYEALMRAADAQLPDFHSSPAQHSSHSKSPWLIPSLSGEQFKLTPSLPFARSDGIDYSKGRPDYSVFPPGFSPEPLLPTPTALHILTQNSAGGASQTHSHENSA